MIENQNSPLVVAIDGPAGAGKSTVAARIAARYGLLNLETGAMYRAFALKAIQTDSDTGDGEELGRLAEKTRIRLMPGARALIATLRRTGVKTALVSGGFTVFAERVAAELGFDRVIANRLDITAGKLAGTVRPPIVTGATKRDTLVSLAGEFGLALDETLAVGDGANDLPMLMAAGLGIAFHAKPAVAAAARARIDHADLTALLYAQGYREGEIVG